LKPGCDSKIRTRSGARPLPRRLAPGSGGAHASAVATAPAGAPRFGESRRGRWRAIALIGLNLAMIAHFVHWRFAGRTISPIEPSESMQTLQEGAVNAGFIFFALAILATLIFGRFVCGWGCHIVALQDLCGWMMKRIGITPKPFRSRLLMWVPLIAALYMFVWPTFYRAFLSPERGPVIPEFTNHLITDNFWGTFPGFWLAVPFLLICGFATVYFLGAKGFCTYGCPYGGFFGVADKVAPGKIRVTDACNQCGHCTAVCTSNVLVHAEVKQYGMVVDAGCMKCMDCVDVCPNDALYFGFGKPTIFAPKPASKSQRSYSIGWGGEIAAASLFLGSFLAVRGVYGIIPFLMALGCAAVTTFLALKGWELLQPKAVYFHKFQLRTPERIAKSGALFLVVATAAVGLTLHSGWIRYHEYRGHSAFQKLQIPDELALARANPALWLSPTDRAAANVGRQNLQVAARTGLLANGDTLSKLAWFEYLLGRSERAVELLTTAAENQKDEAKALSLYYRGTILNRLGRPAEAGESLDAALAVRENLILARQERGESFWQAGAREQAIATWADALRRNAQLPLTASFLAGAYRAVGRIEEATAAEQQADQTTPDVPAYHWMVGMRLTNVGMNQLAEKHYARAIQLDATFRYRPR
jgi:tetratricopeptide (TPR) repeat protein/ferredoxin